MTFQSGEQSKVAKGRLFNIVSRFRRDRRGSVAIEFSMLILPFSLLMFAVIETSVSFGAQQLMANVTDDLARSMRTGKIKTADINETKLRNLICDRIDLLMPSTCPELVFDLRKYNDYAAIPKEIKYKPDGDIDTAGFKTELGGPVEIHALRVFYRWPIMTDFMRGKLSTMPDGKTLLYSAMVWQNEPYTPGSSSGGGSGG
jgi:Flp pilus assembly protein TadG